MEDDGVGSGQQERVEDKGVDEGQRTTTDQQSTIDGSCKDGQGYSYEGKGCAGSEWSIPPPHGPWQQWTSWGQWQGGGRQQTSVAAAVRQ